ncbi:uncharacterized protein LOC134209875 isoform X2 [Armigeres subalbatus]
MDDYVKSILLKWELPELIPTFQDEEVNEKAFKCLTDDIVRELIPKLGKRAIFNKAYKEYCKSLKNGVDPGRAVPDPKPDCRSLVSSETENRSEILLDKPEKNSLCEIHQNVELCEDVKIDIVVKDEFPTLENDNPNSEEPQIITTTSIIDDPYDESQPCQAPPIVSDVEIETEACDENPELSGENFDSDATHGMLIDSYETQLPKIDSNDGIDQTTAESHAKETLITVVEYSGDEESESSAIEVIKHSPQSLKEVDENDGSWYGEGSSHKSATSIIEDELEQEPSTSIPNEDTTITESQQEPEAEPERPTAIEFLDDNPSRITFSISALTNPSDADLKNGESLRQLLNSSSSIGHLLGKPFLTRSSRNTLAEGIVEHLCATNEGLLSRELLRKWARAVELVFKQEINELYFRESEDGYTCGGKLVQCCERLGRTMEGM